MDALLLLLQIIRLSFLMHFALFNKGHDAQAMQDANFGMATPAGYRMVQIFNIYVFTLFKAQRLMFLGEHFNLPVVSLVDTPGAYPSFQRYYSSFPTIYAQ